VKFFNRINLPAPPPIEAIQNKLLKEKEARIFEEIKRLKQLKEINPKKFSGKGLQDIFSYSD